MRTVSHRLLTALLLLLLPHAASADVLENLASPQYTVRQAATRDLLTDTTRSLDELKRLFQAATTPEQRYRLLDVIRHHQVRELREQNFEARGRASIGFSHEIVPAELLPPSAGTGRHGAIHVVDTLPGFPGHAWFEPGDLIVEIDDQPLAPDITADQFQTLLKQWEAGDMLSFIVLRGDQRLSFQIRLASIAALARIYGNDPSLKPPYVNQWHALRSQLLTTAPPVPVLTLRQDEPATDPATTP